MYCFTLSLLPHFFFFFTATAKGNKQIDEQEMLLIPNATKDWMKSDFYLHYIQKISKVDYKKSSVMQYARARRPRSWHHPVQSTCACYKYVRRFHTAYAWQRFLVNNFADFLDVQVKKSRFRPVVLN